MTHRSFRYNLLMIVMSLVVLVAIAAEGHRTGSTSVAGDRARSVQIARTVK